MIRFSHLVWNGSVPIGAVGLIDGWAGLLARFPTQRPSVGKTDLKIHMWVCGWAEMPPRTFDRLHQLELLDLSSRRTW